MNSQSVVLTFLWLTLTFSKIVGADEKQSYSWSAPTRVITAVCSKFSSVSELPQSLDTVDLISKTLKKVQGTQYDTGDQWENGTAVQFLSWLDSIEATGNKEGLLIFYFSTHQLTDGSLKFSDGKDLGGFELVQALNKLSSHFQRVLFINDSCYAASLEKCGVFSENILRLYASQADETALDIEFKRAPYGVDEFFGSERSILKKNFGFYGEGLSFLALVSVKAIADLTDENTSQVDLTNLLTKIESSVREYYKVVRQPSIQKIVVYPRDANLPLLKRIKYIASAFEKN